MSNKEREVETITDFRFGQIDVLTGEDSSRRFIKRTQYNSEEEYNAAIEALKERKIMNNDVLITVYEIRGYPDDFISEIVYEFPDSGGFDAELGVKERIIAFRCILEALAFMQDNKKVHGDIRGEYIAFYKGDCWAKLVDRLGDRSSPLQCQLGNIKKKRSLYMPPWIFEKLVSQCGSIRHNGYKTDTFSLGMCMLETFCRPQLVQALYDKEEGKFNFEGLDMILAKLISVCDEEPTKAFVVFLKENVLCFEEAGVLNPKESLAVLKAVPGLKTLWDLVFYSDEEAKEMQAKALQEESKKEQKEKTVVYDPKDFVEEEAKMEHQRGVREFLTQKGDGDRELTNNVVRLNSNLHVDVESTGLLAVSPDVVAPAPALLANSDFFAPSIRDVREEPNRQSGAKNSIDFAQFGVGSVRGSGSKHGEIKEFLKSLGIAADDLGQEETVHYLISKAENAVTSHADIFASHRSFEAPTPKKLSEILRERTQQPTSSPASQAKEILDILDNFIDITEPSVSGISKPKKQLQIDPTLKFTKNSVPARPAKAESAQFPSNRTTEKDQFESTRIPLNERERMNSSKGGAEPHRSNPKDISAKINVFFQAKSLSPAPTPPAKPPVVIDVDEPRVSKTSSRKLPIFYAPKNVSELANDSYLALSQHDVPGLPGVPGFDSCKTVEPRPTSVSLTQPVNPKPASFTSPANPSSFNPNSTTFPPNPSPFASTKNPLPSFTPPSNLAPHTSPSNPAAFSTNPTSSAPLFPRPLTASYTPSSPLPAPRSVTPGIPQPRFEFSNSRPDAPQDILHRPSAVFHDFKFERPSQPHLASTSQQSLSLSNRLPPPASSRLPQTSFNPIRPTPVFHTQISQPMNPGLPLRFHNPQTAVFVSNPSRTPELYRGPPLLVSHRPPQAQPLLQHQPRLHGSQPPRR